MKIPQRIRIGFLLIFCLLTICNICAAQKDIDGLNKAKFFEKAKKEYQSFERLHGHTIQTENVNMHYLTWGDPNGLPFVWAHGTGSDSYELLNFADSIVAMGCYLISIDYYGHGQTPIPLKDVSVYHVADDMKFLIDSLGLTKVLIGGLSRGGTIATAFYDEYPENVLGIVLEDGGSVNWNLHYHKMGLDSVIADLKEWTLTQDTLPIFTSQEEVFFHYFEKDDETNPFQLLNSIRKFNANEWDLNPGLWEWLDEDTYDGLFRGTFMPTLSPLFQYSTGNLEPQIVYRNLHVPMLIYDPQSDTDMFDFTEENKTLAEKHPELITHIIYENTRHALMFQRPERFLKDLSQFIEEVKHYHKIE